jgi:HsdM N-terminal domain
LRGIAQEEAMAAVDVTPARPTPQSETIRNHAAFIWSVADLLRGDYKQSEYGKVILPLTVIRRLDCVLEPTKQSVLAKNAALAGRIENVEPVLQAVAGQQFWLKWVFGSHLKGDRSQWSL